MAYVPTARTVTVDMSMLSGPVIARWYDPAAGTFASIAGSPFTTATAREFETTRNSAGGPRNEDWVRVLEVCTALGVSGIAPSPVDLAAVPGSFALRGGGFADAGFGLPVVNFMRD